MPPTDPVWQTLQHFYGGALSDAMRAIAELGVADLLDEVPQTAEALAARVGANPDALHRVLRLMAGHGMFREQDGRFTHTDLSRVLRSDHPRSQRAFIRIGTISRKVFASLHDTLRTGRPAAPTLAPGGLFAYLAAHPKEALLFEEGMTSKANADTAGLLRAYDFSRFRVIADIGGGLGHLIKAILRSTPRAAGILFDLPQVVAATSALNSDRLTVQAGDFFADPLPTCDAYVLMNVIHDWADAQAAAIFAAVRRAAPQHAKLLVIEAVMPENPQPGPTGAHPAVWMDVFMLALTGGRERTDFEYANLLQQAGFSLDRVIPTETGVSILESTPRVR
jgi:hypothetical protein